MDGTNPPPEKSGDLNFDKVDDGAKGPSQSNCVLCHEPLTYQYYEVNQQVVCPPCKDKYEEQMERAQGPGRYIKAFLFGLPAGMVGAGIYYAIIALTGYQIGLIAILIGYMVGLAVRYGSSHRGGIGLQLMAALITYCAICSTYIPAIIQGMQEEFGAAEFALEETVGDEGRQEPADGEVGSMSKDEAEELLSGVITDKTLEDFDRYSPAGGLTTLDESRGDIDDAAPARPPQGTVAAGETDREDVTLVQLITGYAVLFAIALAVPWLMGFSNVIGWLIIGFGVYQAWIMNKYTPLEFKGPFDIKRR
ncbi:MAG: hypothetical protein KC900_15075 [Candidatus Omnitrophica bacterium]|nr:hypothetical protein [Candidatus Omnitrophota bacterium]